MTDCSVPTVDKRFLGRGRLDWVCSPLFAPLLVGGWLKKETTQIG